MSTLCPCSSNGSEIASAIRRATRSTSAADSICGKNIVNSSPASRASSGRGTGAVAKLGGDDDAQAVGDHDQQLVAAGVAKAVVDVLEAVEVDEQHRRLVPAERAAEQLVGLGAEMQAVGKRGDRVVHAQRMGILDRRANFREQAVDRGGKLGHCFRGRSRGAGW